MHVRRLGFELLEKRQLLSLTVITHGYQGAIGGDVPVWLIDMGQALAARQGLSCDRAAVVNSIIAYDQASNSVPPNSCEALLLFDWSKISGLDHLGSANADQVSGKLAQLVRARLPDRGQSDVHFIGHSRGAYAVIDAIARLSEIDHQKIGWLQLTTLDPQLAGDDGRLYVPAGVDWADNYYQQSSGFWEPAGKPVPGAFNIDVTAALEQWPGRSGAVAEHQEIHDWYHGTIDTSFFNEESYPDVPALDRAARDQLYTTLGLDFDQDGNSDTLDLGQRVGYYFSLTGRGVGTIVQDADGDIYTADLTTGQTPLYLGRTPTIMHDLAYSPNGVLYGVNYEGGFNEIYHTFDENNQPQVTISWTFQLGWAMNSLSFRQDGQLFSAWEKYFFEVGIDPRGVTIVSQTPYWYKSAGDLAFDTSGGIYLTTTSGDLLYADSSLKMWRTIGNTGYGDIYGLVLVHDVLYGFRDTEELVRINRTTGAAAVVADMSRLLRGIFGATTMVSPAPLPLPPNQAPVAQADIFRLGRTAVSITAASSVLTNDADADGNALQAVLIKPTLTGTISLSPAGVFTFTPGPNYWNGDSFTYQASDGTEHSQTVTVTLISHDAELVQKLYQQVLGRAPDAEGWRYWTQQLMRGAASLGVLASGIFESPERLNPIIAQMYRDYLFRKADESGLSFWRARWQQDGGPDHVIAGIVSSEEFFRQAGSNNRAWVEEMYRRLLKREPDEQGLTYWEAKLTSGALQRWQVVLRFVQSEENFRLLVRAWYRQYLQRSPGSDEEGRFVWQLINGQSPRAIQIQLLDSAEYRNQPPAPPFNTAIRI